MSNPAQVDNAKHKTMLTPRETTQVVNPPCAGAWLPTAVEIATEDEEYEVDYEVPPPAIV